jgi:endonuclease/exonuclease/phosphatase family metal-dependent hydrolase
MRIATWNCYRGGCLERAAELSRFTPDITVLQECARPVVDKRSEGRVVWFGDNPAHGVGVVARGAFRVAVGPVDASFDHSAFPVVVSGPTSFNLLAIWALPRPNYVRAMSNALDVYSGFLMSGPSVIVGDFNCFAGWSGSPPTPRHVRLARRLREELGFVSAYHASPRHRSEHGDVPTHFWLWKESNPYHIDFCFVPASWATAIRSVHVEPFSAQAWRSDHRPVVVDLALPPGRRRPSLTRLASVHRLPV